METNLTITFLDYRILVYTAYTFEENTDLLILTGLNKYDIKKVEQ